jgi:hypothetical protein
MSSRSVRQRYVEACIHPGLLPDNFAPDYSDKVAYEAWLAITHLCPTCGEPVSNREL